MEVGKVMIPFNKLITCRTTETVKIAIDKMAEFEVNSIVIIDDKAVVGIITSHDIFSELTKSGEKGFSTKLDDIMSTTLIYVNEYTHVNVTITQMELARTHHLLVKNDEGIVTGLISSFDIVREKAKDFAAHPWTRQ